MDALTKAKLRSIDGEIRRLWERLGDVESDQIEHGRRFDRVERSIRTVLTCLERMGAEQRRFHNQTTEALRGVISATRGPGYTRRR